MKNILVTGSLHYDIVLDAHHRPEKGETVMGTACDYKFGGKGGNQAIAAAQAGAQVKFIGAVGEDDQGRFLIRHLEEAGVDASAVQVVQGIPSGMSVAITDADGDYGAVVVSNANLYIKPARDQGPDFWDDVALLVLQNEVPSAVNLEIAQAAHARGIPVCLNAAPARVLQHELTACIELLVVNSVEARDMSGIQVVDLITAQAAAEALSATFARVVVTAGEHGVAFCEKGQSAVLPAIKVELVSTHGAGDCFVGVLSQALTNGADLATAVAIANRSAAIHVSRSL
ncbi:PfkB family carbohydrate kinase [Ectopseudomonas oleovorans]|uniref:PfkB family carbohydrate kinase n=1 Tax=Ectopseudomonas oleovorans TaxID=301 RepID=UPI000E253CEF|nr:PfkB family carbohydrate kinase [Pseudomonas oleovorans]